ncbi:MAG: SUMF1/EgtB/PvdO family nonheme iron enzyme [Verrucomicrobiota bacterium]
MSLRRFKRGCAQFWESYRVVFFSILGICALGCLYYFLANIGPRAIKPDYESVSLAQVDDAAKQALIDEVDRLEKIYRQAATADLMTAEAMQALEQAVEKQRQLMLMYPAGDYTQGARLTELETRLGSARAAGTVERIEQLQKDGESALQDARYEEAARVLGEALALQRSVNASSASPRYKNYVRETALLQSISAIEATPLFREKEAAVKAAQVAVAEERWGDALSAYVLARDLQGRLNREYARTRYADLSGFDRLESEIASLNSAGVAAEIDAKEKAADRAAGAGDHEAAARLYGEAYILQQEINLKYVRSRFVSSARLERLATKQQNAQARPHHDRLVELDARITADLAARRVVSAEQHIPEATALLERIGTDFPKNDFQLGALKIKLAYLFLKRDVLRRTQDEVYDQLLPLPGVGGVLLLKTELPQQIYAEVMNTNPSRNPGRTLPVDSVNWSDAAEFCTRMGWILGLEVRLPTPDEFRVAIGEGGGRVVTAGAGGDGKTQPVSDAEPNAYGFADLLGNAGEWLHVTTGTTAPVGGGSYLDREVGLQAIPIENRPRIDRARHISFRFVVLKPERD